VLCKSKWLNGVSVRTDEQGMNRLRTQRFIRSVEPLRQSIAHTHRTAMALSDTCGYDPILSHYGLSDFNLSRIGVKPLNALGFDASGVLMGFFDTGFHWSTSEALRTRKVIQEYDFVFRDSVTTSEPLD